MAVDKERFAFDVFVYTMARFNTNIPKQKCKENTYESPDYFRVLSRGYIPYQLVKRDTWIPIFEAEFETNGLKKFEHISELLKGVLKEMDDVPGRTHFGRAIISLALINELIQFLYSKNHRLFLNDLARFWKDYFAPSESAFEEEGGLSKLYSVHSSALFRICDIIIDYFIPNYCFPYGKKAVSSKFPELSSDPSFLDSLKKIFDKKESDTTALASSLEEKLLIARRSSRLAEKKTEPSSSVENIGLGIRPHEELLRDYLSVDNGTSKKPVKSSVVEASAAFHVGVKLLQKPSGQDSQEQEKRRGKPSTPITSPKVRSRDRVGMTKSLLTLEERSKDPADQTELLLNPKEQSEGRRVMAGPPLSSLEVKRGRGSSRAPEGISRLEQKRQKYLKSKKHEPTK